MSDLKPCPFCGGEAEFERVGSLRYSTIVVCTDCGARHESGDVGDLAGMSWNIRPAENNQMKADALRAFTNDLLHTIENQFDGGDDTEWSIGANHVFILFNRELFKRANKLERESANDENTNA